MYLRRWPDLGLRYGAPADGGAYAPLHGYCDASWASCVDTRRSCSGVIFYAWGGAITWTTKREKIVALSSTEAEYCATTHAVRECAHLSRAYTMDFGYKSLKIDAHQDITEAMFERDAHPVSIMTDNISCQHLSKNPVLRARSKHMALRWHYCRDQVKEGAVRLVYCPTKEMAADIFTKALAKGPFEHIRDKIMHPLPGTTKRQN